MALTNRELFAKALGEALSREYREELADCTETAECSLSHYKKMSKILEFNVVPESMRLSFKKKLVIAILAAALLLAGCTAVVFRNEIKGLFEEVFDTFIAATYDEGRDSTGAIITEYYKPTYLPTGYALDDEIISPAQAIYRYKEDSGYFLKFEQILIGGCGYIFDNDNVETLIVEIGELNVYYRFSSEYYHYVWTDGVYVFRLTSQYEMPINEIEMIVLGIK